MRLTTGMFISLAIVGGLLLVALMEIATYAAKLAPLFQALGGK